MKVHHNDEEEQMKKLIVAVLLLTLTAPAFAGSAATSAPRDTESRASTMQKLDINRATQADLVAVPGIGERLAQAIVDLRERKGTFAKLDDLLEIRGIGEKNLAHFADYLTVVQAPQTAVGTASPAK